MSIDLVVSAILWTTFAVVVSQAVCIGIMWLLGLSPVKLTHEIVEVQNPAVGAVFFVVSVPASLFVALMASSGFTPDPSALESATWIVGGVALATAYAIVLLAIAQRALERRKRESLFHFIRRELIEEQNLSLALFLGGLAITPFIAVVFQLI